MLVFRIGSHSGTELLLQRNEVKQMLLILKPILMTAWKSRAFKELIIAMLERIVTRTDNDLDDLALSHLRVLLLPDTRVEK